MFPSTGRHPDHSTRNVICLVALLPVADLRGVRGVQMHPPLAASNVFLRTYLYEIIQQWHAATTTRHS